jgi:hypothetical protein
MRVNESRNSDDDWKQRSREAIELLDFSTLSVFLDQ